MVSRKDGARPFAGMVPADLEERLEQVARDGLPHLMGIRMPPCVIGQPWRPRAPHGALQAGAGRRGEAWTTTAGAIPGLAAALPGEGVP